MKLDGGVLQGVRTDDAKTSYDFSFYNPEVIERFAYKRSSYVRDEGNDVCVQLTTPSMQQNRTYLLYTLNGEARENKPPAIDAATFTQEELAVYERHGVYGVLGKQMLDIVGMVHLTACPPAPNK